MKERRVSQSWQRKKKNASNKDIVSLKQTCLIPIHTLSFGHTGNTEDYSQKYNKDPKEVLLLIVPSL